MTNKYHTAVFIGRFQPFHIGHEAVIWKGLEVAEEVVIVVGSSYAPPSLRNPFTYEQRKAMIKAVFPQPNVKVVPVMDYPYNDKKWIAAVKGAVGGVRSWQDKERTCLIGHSKDATSYYLKIFQSWDGVEVPAMVGPIDGARGFKTINATDLRNQMYETRALVGEPLVSWVARDTLGTKMSPVQWETLMKEYAMIKDYKKQFECMPYPPTFVTVDAVVTISDKILLVKRGAAPGEGLLAMPGGFLDQSESLFDGAIRELREETRLKVPDPVLRGSVKAQHTFDDPHRSSRGRTLTTAFHIDLGMDQHLPKVKGSDDAVDAFWMDIDKLDPSKFFEDHYGIIDYFLNIA